MPKQRTTEEQRDYMRQYRARKKATPMLITPDEEPKPPTINRVAFLEAEVERLTEEVHRLKQELANRPIHETPAVPTDAFPVRKSFNVNAIAGPTTATPRGVSSAAGGTPHGPNRGGQRRGSGEGRAGGSTPTRSPDPSASEHDDGRPVFHPEKSSPDRLSKSYFARKRNG